MMSISGHGLLELQLMLAVSDVISVDGNEGYVIVKK